MRRISQMRLWCVPWSRQQGAAGRRRSTMPTSPSLVPQQAAFSFTTQSAFTSWLSGQVAAAPEVLGSAKLRLEVLATATSSSRMRFSRKMLLRWTLSATTLREGRSQVMILLQLPATSRPRSSIRSIAMISRPWLKLASSRKKSVTTSSVIRSSLTSNSLISKSMPRVTTPNPPGPDPFFSRSKMYPSCSFCEISKGCSLLKGPWLAFQKLTLPSRLPTSRYLSMTARPQAPSGSAVLITSNSSSRLQTLILPRAGCLRSRQTRWLLQTNCFSLSAASFFTSRQASLLAKWRKEASLPAQSGADPTGCGSRSGSRSISQRSFSLPKRATCVRARLQSPATPAFTSPSCPSWKRNSSLAARSPSAPPSSSRSRPFAALYSGWNFATYSITSRKCDFVATSSPSEGSATLSASSTMREVTERAAGAASGFTSGFTSGSSAGGGRASRSPSAYLKILSGWPWRMCVRASLRASWLASSEWKVTSACPFFTSMLCAPNLRSRKSQIASGEWKVSGMRIIEFYYRSANQGLKPKIPQAFLYIRGTTKTGGWRVLQRRDQALKPTLMFIALA